MAFGSEKAGKSQKKKKGKHALLCQNQLLGAFLLCYPNRGRVSFFSFTRMCSRSIQICHKVQVIGFFNAACVSLLVFF